MGNGRECRDVGNTPDGPRALTSACCMLHVLKLHVALLHDVSSEIFSFGRQSGACECVLEGGNERNQGVLMSA
jgi:hypothetical protein